jgi:hypothetical protein
LQLNKIALQLFALTFLLTACQGATQSVPEPTEGDIPAAISPLPTMPDPTSLPETTASGGSPVGAACTVVSPQPTPGPTEESLFPPVSPEEWTRGPDTAAVTIVEYSDFQ